MKINSNVASLSAQKALSGVTRELEKTSRQLSSGQRIHQSADDPASIAIGAKHKATLMSQKQAARNANDAISEFQISEGAMNEVGAMLTRLKELSVQGASEHIAPSDRMSLNEEYMQLRHEIERISTSTSFNGVALLASDDERNFQVGITDQKDHRLNFSQEKLIVNEFSLGIVDSTLDNEEEARINLNHVDNAITKLGEKRAIAGSMQNRLQFAANNLEISALNEGHAYSRRMDTDYAEASANNVQKELQLRSSTAVLAQTNELGKKALKLIS